MDKIQAKVAELKEKMEGPTGANGTNYCYVSYYKNIKDFGFEPELNEEEAFEEIMNRIETIHKPTKEELNEGFMVIDESGSTRFEVVLKDNICDYKG